MKQYKIYITKRAKFDINRVYNHIAFDLCEPETAEKQYGRIMKNIGKLDMLPERVKIMESKRAKALELRRLLVDNYSVIYRIIEDRVVVEAVFCNASNIEERISRLFG